MNLNQTRMNHEFTAIILSYKRPWNIHLICRTILELQNVKKLILSNNNPDIDIENYLKFKDERLVVINQLNHTGCGKRFELAKKEKSHFFLCIDDDLFLDANQTRSLMEKLINDTSRPHGLCGQRVVMKNDSINLINEIGGNVPIEILNRAYFFTKEHVTKFYDLIDSCKIDAPDVDSCDDILISFSGTDKPIIHNVGNYYDCPTSDEWGIATWTLDGTNDRRSRVLKKLLNFGELKP